MLPIPEVPPLALYLFGTFKAWVHGCPLPRLRTRKGNWLLALLALRGGREVDRGWLAGTLWPESSEALAAHSLRTSLADLRRALGPEADRLRSPTTRSLTLDLTGAFVDVAAFDAAIRAGDAGSLAHAVALYRGPLLEDCSEAWAFEERQILQEAFLQALEALVCRALTAGEAEAAEGYLRRAVAADPLRESAHRSLMQVLAGTGQYAAVLQLYRELRLRLHRELNAAPDPETTALFQQLWVEARRRSNSRASVGRVQPPRLPVRACARDRASVDHEHEHENGRRTPSPPCPSPLAPPLLLSLAGGRMVGREMELSALERGFDAALAGRGATFFLAGEPGIGKTRLATEVSAAARQQGFRVLTGRCDEQGSAPYQPFGEALRDYLDAASREQAEETLPPPVACELVRLVPRLAEKVNDVPRIAATAGAGARQALSEAVSEFFSLLAGRQGPVLLFLDDLHWADEGSLALLSGLARRAPSLRLLIVGTYRDLPPDFQHPLEQTLAALNRERLSERLPLRRLPEGEVAQMVAALLPKASPPADFVTALHRETEGNPFFVEEVLKHLMEEGTISWEVGCWRIRPLEEAGVPQSVKLTINRRLERFSPESREALALAAVMGQEFGFEALLLASDLDEGRLLVTVEEWLGARLVVEEHIRAATGCSPEGGRWEQYRFQHALIREVLYDGLSRRRRARLHERVGLALEAVCASSVEEHLEELAHHFAQARSGAGVGKGVDYCLRAGEKARNLYANGAAIRHLAAALGLMDELPAADPHLRKRWEVVDHLWRAHRDSREYERAREVLRDYLALARQAGCAWGMAAAHWGMAMAVAVIFDWEGSNPLQREHLENCLLIAEEHGLADWQARARVVLARHLVAQGNRQRAEALLRQTLHAPEGVPGELVQHTYQELVLICAWQGKWDAVAEALRQSIDARVPSVAAGCLNVVEEGLNRAGKRTQFIALCEEAKARSAQAGLPVTLNQWYLEPAAPSEEFHQLLFRDDFGGPELRPEWQWQDPHPPAAGTRVSSYSLAERPGHLTLRAGPGVDLYPPHNLNAPRLLLEVGGDFALETKMAGDWVEKEFGISGLLVWKDALNYVRLDKNGLGYLHRGDIHLEGRVAGEYALFGRGELWGDSYYLRLERTGDRCAALCSIDGEHWLTCGHVVLPVRDPLQVGVWAGCGVGTGMNFDYVQLLGRG